MVNRITRKSKGGNKNTTLKKLGGGGDGEKKPSMWGRVKGLFKKKEETQDDLLGQGPKLESATNTITGRFLPKKLYKNWREITKANAERLKQNLVAKQETAAEEGEEEEIQNIAGDPSARTDATAALQRQEGVVATDFKQEVIEQLGDINDRVGKLETDIKTLQETKAEPVSSVTPVSAVSEVSAENKEEDLDAPLTSEEENTNMGRWLKKKDAEQEEVVEPEEVEVVEPDSVSTGEQGPKGGKSRRRRRRSKGKSRRKRGRR